MKVGILQFEPLFGEKDRNLGTIVEKLEDVDADLVILPELAFTGYQFADKDELSFLADRLDSPYIAQLKDFVAQKGMAMVFGFAEKTFDGRLFNSALLLLPDGGFFLYRKTHLFCREKELFEPGDTGFNVFDFNGVKIGLAICFDWYFPEAFRTLAMKGAHIIAHPANLVMPYCQRAVFARAVENRVFVFTANRVGSEERWRDMPLKFTGESVAVTPEGNYLLRLSQTEEELKVVEIDPFLADDKFLSCSPENHPFIDRRVEYYL